MCQIEIEIFGVGQGEGVEGGAWLGGLSDSARQLTAISKP
jgi:hypothetical protein